MAKVKGPLIVFGVDLTSWRKSVRRMQLDAERLAGKLRQTLGRALRGLAVAAGASGLITKQFADFEQGLAAVQKITKESDETMQEIGESIRALSKDTIYSTDQLLELTKAAGVLGIKGKDDLLVFTEVMAKLATASNEVLAGEDAAFMIARLMEVGGEPIQNVERLASVIVQLGNNFATNEREIVENATNIIAAVRVFGATADDALAMGAAVAAVGQDGTKAATAMGKLMAKMQEAAKNGGEAGKTLERLMGDSLENIRKKFDEDAVGATANFVAGLGQAGKAGRELLYTLGLTDDRTNRVILGLASSGDAFERALVMAREEMETGMALQREYDIFVKTLTNRFKILLNNIRDVAIAIGAKLAPYMLALINGTIALIDKFDLAGDSASKTGSTILRLTTGFTLALTAVVSLRLGLTLLRIAFYAAAGGAKVATIAARLFWASATLGLTLLIAYLPEITAWWKKDMPAAVNAGLTVLENGISAIVRGLMTGMVVAMEAIERLVLRTRQVFYDGLESIVSVAADAASKLGDLLGISTGDGLGNLLASIQKRADDAAKAVNGLSGEYAAMYRTINESHAGTGIFGRLALPVAADGTATPHTVPARLDSEAVGSGEGYGTDAAKTKADAAKKEREDAEAAARNKRAIEAKQSAERRRGLHKELEILRAHNDKLENVEIEFIRRRQEIEQAERELKELRLADGNTAEIILLKEKIELKKAAYDEDIEQYNQHLLAIDELMQAAREADAEQSLLDLERKKEMLLAGRKLEIDEAKTRLRIQKESEQRQLDARKNFWDSMRGLQNSGNKAMRALGKAAAIHDLILAITSDAPKAFAKTSAAFAWPLGPVLGALHAAGIVASSAGALGQIRGMATGGVVGGQGLTDNQLMALTPGELVVNKADTDELFEQLRNGGQGEDITVNVNVDGAVIAQAVARRDFDNRAR